MGTSRKIKSNPGAKQKKFWHEFGIFLQQKRASAGLSEAEVAQYLGATVPILLGYESGEKAIPLNRIYALANCLNISPEEIVKKISTLDSIQNH
jgi:transcriptional regulator with XRE-family HTH domain